MNPTDIHTILRLVFALTFVLALMGLLHLFLRRLRERNPLQGGKRRLSVIETLPLDARRKLVLVQRDHVEHLVILGTTGETVIEHGIESGQDTMHDTLHGRIHPFPQPAEGQP
jgi:flagellar protein FliO/FliZ